MCRRAPTEHSCFGSKNLNPGKKTGLSHLSFLIVGGVAGALWKTGHLNKVGENQAGNPEKSLQEGMKWHYLPRWRRDEGLRKGGTSVMGTKEKQDLQGGGQRGSEDQKGSAGACGWADPEGSPYRAELTGGEASPASRTQNDRRRRRPRLPGSASEPTPAVAILPLG